MRLISGCLCGVILSLLVVGIVSATPVRHVIQIAPVVIALVVTARKTTWSQYAALPLFVFWLVIMSFIWLWLLGIANVITGHFSATEVAMTIGVGLCCMIGIPATLRMQSGASLISRIAAFLIFFSLQVFAMWISLLEQFSHS